MHLSHRFVQVVDWGHQIIAGIQIDGLANGGNTGYQTGLELKKSLLPNS